MHLNRLARLSVAGFCLAFPPTLYAQATAPASAPPWTPDKQYSTDETISTPNGMTIAGRMFTDNGKIRTEASMNGMNVVAIIRPDEKKMYSVMPAQKMVMEMPLSPDKLKQVTAMTTGPDSKYAFVGPDVINGTPTLKYKMTVGTDPKAFFWWINVATKTPVKIAAEDGSVNIAFTNYKVGPQDAALFEPPAGFQVIEMPGAGAPGGGAPGGGGPSAPAPGQ